MVCDMVAELPDGPLCPGPNGTPYSTARKRQRCPAAPVRLRRARAEDHARKGEVHRQRQRRYALIRPGDPHRVLWRCARSVPTSQNAAARPASGDAS